MADKVRRRSDGSSVLLDESGNPNLGVIITPAGRGQLLLTGICGEHALDVYTVTLGTEQVGELRHLVGGP
jgi:hypothetical protein